MILAFALACTTRLPPQPLESDLQVDLGRASDGTPEAVGLLAFLADPATTVRVLDDQVPLDARAAKNLVAHRDGPDRVHATADDDPFDTVDEVDAVSYVGASAMDALFAWVGAHGWVPAGDDVLGTWDGVTFTVDEAAATVDLANTATHDELDVGLGLDKRAADSIVAARPIPTVLALSELYYVGGSALTALKAAASTDPCDDQGGAWLGGDHFALLPDAVAAAQDGDTVVVCDGGFGDPIVVERDLTLRSVHGSAATTLDVTAMGASAIEVRGHASLALDGFTVTYGEGTVDASGRRRGSGLYAATTGDVTVTGCQFQENYAEDGGGLANAGPGLLTLTDTVVRSNHAVGDGGGLWTAGPVVIDGGSFEANDAGAGGAIRVVGDGTVDASAVVLGDNAPDDVRTGTSWSVDGATSFRCDADGCDSH